MQLLKRSFQLSVFRREAADGRCSVVRKQFQIPRRASASPREHLSHSSTSSRGSALLIVLGMLSFLLISSVAFAVYMRVERMATSNYRHSVMARQLIQLAFADARNTVTEIVDNNKSTFWPIFYKATPEARVLMSLPKWRDSDGNMRDTDYPDAYTTGATASSAEGTGLSFTPGAGPSILSDEVIKHVPPALVRDVMNARWQAQWRPIKQPQLVESDSGGSVSVNPVIGRYAWMAVNVSDMLDVNVIGTNTLSGKRNFGSLGGPDLKLDGDAGVLNSASTYKTAANVGDLKARFVTGADLASLADYSGGFFNQKVLDWRSAVGLSTLGGTIDDAAPLTVYSRFPVMPPPVLPVALTIQDWTNNMAIPMDQLNSTMAAGVKAKLATAIGPSGLQSGLAGTDFADMIMDYVAPNGGTLYSGNTKGMLMPPMKPAPMISQIWFDFGSLQSALYDPTSEQTLVPGQPLTITVNPNAAGLGSAAQIRAQVANLFDEDWTGSSTVDVQGGWAVFWNDGGAKNSKGTAFVSSKNATLGTVEKGTFSSASLQYGFPNIGAITIAAPSDGLILTVDLFFRLVINGLDEVPLSEVGIAQAYNPGNDPALDLNTASFCGERYFKTRIAFRLVKTVVMEGATTKEKWKVVPDTTAAGVWSPAAGRWDSIDPRYNWFSPSSAIVANNAVLSQQVLTYFGIGGYNNARSSIHWFFKANGGSSGSDPSELMKAVWDFARTNPNKGLDVVNPSGGYSENGKQRYYAFSHSGLGRMYSPLEFGFFPRQLVAPAADPGAWLNKGVENLPFYRSIRVYPYVSPTTATTSVDDSFLRYFAESIGTSKGLVYVGSPGVVGDYLRDLQFNGLPPAISEVGKTELTAVGHPELDAARLKLADWLGSLADNKFKDLVANPTDPGIRELNYSEVPVASIPPTVTGGATLDIFREIAEIKKLPEVKRKLLAAMTQCGASRRQQLFLYILRADAYKPIIGDSLSGGSSSASCRAVALVWRDPFAKGAETMTGTLTGLYRKEWFRGTTAGTGMGGSTTTTTSEHAERLIYFQILD